jgi:hypothetical protein
MTLKLVQILIVIAPACLGVQAKAQAPCPEVVRLRNVATGAWKDAMRAPQPKRCGALNRAALAAEETLSYAMNNRQSCTVSDRFLAQLDGYHRDAMQARDNVCAGRPMRPYPADIIRQ